MTILQQPDALSLSGNIKKFRIGTTKAVSFVLRQGDREIVSQSYEPGSDNIVVIDIKDIVHSRLNFLFQNTALVYEQTSLVANFAAIIAGTEVLFRAIRTGVDHLADTADNFLIQNFLTWQPSIKPVTYHSPEFLTYYSVVSSVAKLHAYFTDDSGSVISEMDIVLSDFVAGRAYTIPLQYASVSEKLDNKLPAYYDVWVEADGKRLTYIQRYYVSDMKSEEEQWILFENSLGGIDTFRAYGATSLSCEHTHNIAEIDDVSSEYRVDTERKFQKNTGYLDKKERVWLLDFFPSLKKYIYTGAYMRSVVVVESNVTYTDKELPSNYTFTYKYADARPFLNIPRIDIPSGSINITVPEVGSFTVPPRLVEFPRLPLSEGALFPVQEPYAEKWNTTTVSSLSDFIIDKISGSYDGGGGVGHQHTNIDLLNLLSYTADYLRTAGKKIKAGYADEAYPFIKGVAQELIDFAYGLKSDSVFTRNYTPGMLGTGGCLKTDPITGKSSIEVDELYVRLKAIFDSLETKKTTHVGGQQMQTLASIECTQVELLEKEVLYDADDSRLLDAEGNELSGAVSAPIYRCYFLADDGEKAIVNEFVPGDFAQSREFNIKPGAHENVSNRYYWRYVVAAGDNYIDLSVTDCDEGSDIPEAGDTIIQLGNRTDANRQNAIITSAYGENAPSRQMLAGINSYSLADKVVIEEGFDRITNKPYTKNYGNSYIGDRDENTYMRYSPDEGLTIKGNAEITGGSMTLKVSDEKVWKVNDDCVNIVGNPLGKRLEIDASTSKINIFNENSVLVNEIEGESYESLDDVFQGTIPVVTPVPEVKDFITVATLPIEEPIRIEKTTDVLNETYFYLDGTMEMLFNLAFSYTNGVTHGKGEAECGYELHVLKYDKVDGNIIRDIIIRENKASMGSSIVISNEQQVTLDKGFYYRIVAKTFVSVKALSVSNSMHSYITLNAFYFKFIKAGYTSKFFANGLALGTSIENVFALFSKRDLLFGKYINMEAHNENAGFKIEFQKFLVKSNPNGNLECPYGLINRSLAAGKVKIDKNGASFLTLVCANSEDKYDFTVEKIIEGVCRITFPKSWAKYDIIGSGYMMVSGVMDGMQIGPAVLAGVSGITNSGCRVSVHIGETLYNGSFFFEIKMY